MADLFFYGTLCHVPLLERVLGRSGIGLVPASLPDHTAVWAEGEAFPLLVPAPGQAAEGLLAAGLSEEDIARLVFYEGGFEFGVEQLTVLAAQGEVRANVFYGEPGRWTAGAPWDLAQWQARWAATIMRAAEEIMAWYGRFTPEQIAQNFTPIGIHATAWVSAQARPADPDRDVSRDVVVQDHRRSFLAFFGMEEIALRFRRHDGTMSEVMNRGMINVGEAVVVLPYDPVLDRVLLVEQFRAPVFMAGDPAPWVWEPVAGLVDPGETPETAARREAEEEAGLAVRRLEPAGGVYSSTGSSNEFLNLFIGIADLSGHPDGGGGLEHEGEDIRSAILGYDELMDGVDRHIYRDMPLVTCALWLARHRERLRNQG